MAGIVSSQAKPISRTTSQRTWCQRRRPPPTPTTDDATTWVVETGAPTYDEARITAVDEVWLASPSSFERRKMRRPIVRTMRQPPSTCRA